MADSLIDLLKFFKDGGPFMVFVLCISIASVILIVERFLALRIRYHIDGRALFNEVKKYLAANDQRRALEVCRQYPNVPLAQILAAGIQHMDHTIEEIDVAMESEILYHVPRINERLQYLPSLANTATLVGLLGTITGLIIAFNGSSGAPTIGGLTKEQALAHGISFAMYTTAFALMVAIPTVLAAMVLGAKANKLIDDVDHYASALKHLLQRRKNGRWNKEEEFKGERVHAQKTVEQPA
jgi:biopolymer transport protein ExbB